MKTTWAIAIKDLRVIARDRTGLLFILFVPLLFAVFFGTMYGGDERRPIAMAVVDEDQSQVSLAYVQGLIDDETLEVETLNLAAAEKGVRKGKFVARLRLLKGFGMLFNQSATGARPKAELGFDPTMRAEAAMLEGMLTRNAMKQAGLSMELAPIQLTQKPMVDAHAPTEPDPFDLSFPQGIVWGLLSVVMAFTTSLVNERTTGTLLRLEVAPIHPRQILAGKAIACFLMNLVVMALLLTLGVGAFGIAPASWPLLGVALLSVSLCMTGLMMLLATFGNNERTTGNIGWTVMMILAMTGGGMIPLFFMSDWMVTASQISPVMWSITVLEGALWRGFTTAEMLNPCAILVGVGALAFAAGSLRFKRAS
jgi:ABC-2 type transport system permease protein